MKNVVMKFGGTSVADADAIRRLIAIVSAQAARSGAPPVVVVSAMSKVTDQLLRMTADASRGERGTIASGVEEIRHRHLAAIDALVPLPGRAAVTAAVEQQIDELRAMLTALAILREASPRSCDGIAAAGELLSSRVVAGALQAAGIDTAWVDARSAIVTDDHYTAAAPLTAETGEALGREVAPHLAAGLVPVIGGYVGATREGVATTLGRGGSDYSASIVGAGIGAEEIQIWTDVDGMLTADPTIVPRRRVASSASPSPRPPSWPTSARRCCIRATVLPAHREEHPRADSQLAAVRTCPARSSRPRPSAERTSDRGRIACKRNITLVNIHVDAHADGTRLPAPYLRSLRPLPHGRGHRDDVGSQRVADDRRRPAAGGHCPRAAGVRRGHDRAQMALLCAVGENLRVDPAFAIRMLAGLDGVPLRMVSQAASRRNVTVVVRDSDLPTAMSRLHNAWFASARDAGSR